MKKRVVAIVLGIIMCLTLLPMGALAAGTEAVAPKYDQVEDFSEGMAGVCLNGKWGFIDKTGREVIPLQYDGAEKFSDGLAWVNLNGKETLIDNTGRQVMPFKYDLVTNLFDGLSSVTLDGRNGYIDRTGAEIISPKYEDSQVFSEGMAAVCQSGKWGYIDKTGKQLIDFKYDEVYSFFEGIAAVCADGKWGFIDKTGKEIAAPRYTEVYSFFEGMAAVRSGDAWGYIDKTGKEVVTPKYDSVGRFCEGLAWVGYDTGGPGWGYIDKTGTEVIPLQFMGVTNFSEGLASVAYGYSDDGSDDTGDCYIDKTGKEVIKTGPSSWCWLYESYTWNSFCEGFAATQDTSGKNGFMDKAGNMVIPYTYDYARDCSEGMAAVCQNGKWGFVSLSAGAATVTPPATNTVTAVPSAQSVTVNGKSVAFDVYNINGNNYFKLRDLAYTLSGTEKQFEVGWDGAKNAISLTSSKAYTAVGGEMAGKGTGSTTGTPTASKIYLDGSEVSFTAYNIGGNNYFKLRDIGSTFGFGVDFDGTTNTVVISTAKGYTA